MSMSTRPQRYIQLAILYEPEGIFLTFPIEMPETIVLQGWGDNPAYHAQFTYNGIRLKGHPGIDLAASPGAPILAADQGRVIEISRDAGGLGRYIKIEHRWGESLYAQLGTILVESGQSVKSGQAIAHADAVQHAFPIHLHFAIRIHPYNRFDGWGGFIDPTPYLYVTDLMRASPEGDAETPSELPYTLPLMSAEKSGVRRP
jgi:murein DD-endopeptidase MepM/ murein hydrolase activator NlpD